MGIRGILGVCAVLFVAGCSAGAGPSTAAPTTTTSPPVTTIPPVIAATPTPPTTTTVAPTSIPTTTVITPTTYVPPGVEPTNPCLVRADFDEPSASEYLAPFQPGRRFQVSQSYCIQLGGHRPQLAYDFAMPIGTAVLAMRAGKVIQIKEDSPDDGRNAGAHNFVFILHDDGTVAFYAHLRQNGIDVAVGDRVEAGQRIAASGNSGQTAGAHLHIQVFRKWPPVDGQDLPLSFSNLSGPLDPRGGLKTGGVYEALETG